VVVEICGISGRGRGHRECPGSISCPVTLSDTLVFGLSFILVAARKVDICQDYDGSLMER